MRPLLCAEVFEQAGEGGLELVVLLPVREIGKVCAYSPAAFFSNWPTISTTKRSENPATNDQKIKRA